MSNIQQSILVTIRPDGTIEIAPSGYKGPKACKDATAFLEKALALQDKKSTPTPESYEGNAVAQRVKT